MRNVTAERTIFCATTPTAGSVETSAAAYVAGAIARMDDDRGWWYNPHQQPVRGITAVAPTLSFTAGVDRTDQASRLAVDGGLLIVRHNDRWLLWGDRLMTSTDGVDDTAVLRILDHINNLLLDESLDMGTLLTSQAADVGTLRFNSVLARHTGVDNALAAFQVGSPVFAGNLASFPINITPNRSITSHDLIIDVTVT